MCDGKEEKTVRAIKRKKNKDIDDGDRLLDAVTKKYLHCIANDLEEKATKNKLNQKNVKNILKYVVTNEEVLKMIKNAMDADAAPSSKNEFCSFEPKVTRAKARELLENKKPLPWPITPLKTDLPESKVLIEKDYSEECSDDEDYMPNESELEKSDEESLLSPHSELPQESPQHSIESVLDKTLEIVTDNVNKSDPIPYRTRSKAPLTDLPLEIIEKSFVPPDITTDMYDSECDDEVWGRFLEEFSFPRTTISENGDDEDADPEYNIMADEKKLKEDKCKEEMRFDKGVKISQKEIQQLMNELVEDFDLSYFDDKEPEIKKKKPKKKSEGVTQKLNTAETTYVKQTKPDLFSARDLQVLSLQMQLHTQLLLQSVVMCSGLKEVENPERTFRNLLKELQGLSGGNTASYFHQPNLEPCLNYMNTLKVEPHKHMKPTKLFRHKIEEIIVRSMLESPAFHFAQILPLKKFSLYDRNFRRLSRYDDVLIAFGFEMFTPFISDGSDKPPGLMDVANVIQKFLIPSPSVLSLYQHIKFEKVKDDGVLQHYFKTGEVPEPKFPCGITLEDIIMVTPEAPIYKIHKLPDEWKTLIPNLYKLKASEKTKRKVLRFEDNYISSLSIYNQGTPVFYIVNNPPRVFNPVNFTNNKPYMSPEEIINAQLSKYDNLEPPAGIIDSNDPPVRKQRSRVRKPRKTARRVKNSVNSMARERHTDSARTHHNNPSAVPSLISALNHDNVPKLMNCVLLSQPFPSYNLRSTNYRPILPKTSCDKDGPSDSALHPVGEEIESESRPEVVTMNNVADQENEDLEITFVTCNGEDDDLGKLMELNSRDTLSDTSKDPNSSEQIPEIEPVITESEGEDELGKQMEPTLRVIFDRKIGNSASVRYYFKKVRNTVDGETWKHFLDLFKNVDIKERNILKLFEEVKRVLKKYPNLTGDFVSILSPQDSEAVGRHVEYSFINNMREFLQSVLMTFSNNPSHLATFGECLKKLQINSNFSYHSFKDAVLPLLKEDPLLIGQFNKIMMTENLRSSLLKLGSIGKKPSSPASVRGGLECTCHVTRPAKHCHSCAAMLPSNDEVPQPSHCSTSDPVATSSGGHSQSVYLPISRIKNLVNTLDLSERNGLTGECNVAPLTELVGPCSDDDSGGKGHGDDPVEVSDTSGGEGHGDDPIEVSDTSDGGDELDERLKDSAPADWTESEDRVILYTCKRHRGSPEAIDAIAAELHHRTHQQISDRLLRLLTLMKEKG